MKNFHYRFLRNYESFKVETEVDSGLMCRVYQNRGQVPITLRVTSLHRFYNFAINENFVTLLTVRVTKLKPGTHMDIGLMYCVYQNQCQELITLG